MNTVSSLRYVESVVGSETPTNWPLEALKAQAVLTQTRLKTRRPGTPLGDSTQSEVYHGLEPITPAVQDAVHAVWGKTLTHQGHPATVFYHSTCGGRTSPASWFRPHNPDFTEKPYLTTVRCTTCGASPFFTPTTHVIPAARFRQAFKGLHPQVVEEDAAGRPVAVRLTETETLSGYAFWLRLGQSFGWDKAPGTQFSLKHLENGGIQITSRGAGHGIGLCQWGAAGLARQGKSYQEILSHYFPGTKISPFP
jgi:stage II sporulation protein D